MTKPQAEEKEASAGFDGELWAAGRGGRRLGLWWRGEADNLEHSHVCPRAQAGLSQPHLQADRKNLLPPRKAGFGDGRAGKHYSLWAEVRHLA